MDYNSEPLLPNPKRQILHLKLSGGSFLQYAAVAMNMQRHFGGAALGGGGTSKPSHLNRELLTLDPKPRTLYPGLYTMNPGLYTMNPEP
jgi:hypothetical protein